MIYKKLKQKQLRLFLFTCLFTLSLNFFLKKDNPKTMQEDLGDNDSEIGTLPLQPYKDVDFRHRNNPKHIVASDTEKIEHGLFLEPHKPFKKFPLIPSFPDMKHSHHSHMNKTRNHKRKLENEATILNDLSIITFNQSYSNWNSLIAYRHVLSNLRMYSSKYLLYPYTFNYTSYNNTNEIVNDGGIFTLDSQKLEGKTFKYLSDISTVELGLSKALYDGHIAILSIEEKVNEKSIDIFWESTYYQTFFVDHLAKVTTITKNFTYFKELLAETPNKGSVCFLDHTNLKEDALFGSDNNTNLFKILIIPDYVYGSEEKIMNYFTKSGIEKIKKFVSNGGTLIASGKSGYLLEKFGLVKSGTYNTTYTLNTKEQNSKIRVKGCEEILEQFNSSESDSTSDSSYKFTMKTLCISNPKISYLSSTFPVENPDNDYITLMSIPNNSTNQLTYKDPDGNFVAIEENVGELPYLLYKKLDKGKIFIFNSNPLYECSVEDRNAFFFNVILDALSRNTFYNNYVNFGDNPIPGGEAGILLKNNFEFYNLFDKVITNFQMYLLFPYNVSVTMSGTECQRMNSTPNNLPLSEGDMNSTNNSWYVLCHKDVIEKFGNFKKNFDIEILDSGVTQKGTAIPLIWPIISYYDNETKESINLYDGPFTVEAKRAAVLRASLNPDPSSFYPLHGKGDFADSVLKVENKENTLAYDVDYISVIPLISPLLDGVDQQQVSYVIDVYDNYYKKHGYKFPWATTGGDNDYIDYYELSNKNIIFIAEWDTPTKISKVLRTEVTFRNASDIELIPEPNGKLDEVMSSYSTIINSTQISLFQMYYNDSDLFYEHATQRLMPFVDTATINGAKAQYGVTGDITNIDNNFRDAVNSNIEKKKTVWCRIDIFFYDATDYQYPTGMNEKVYLSVDKYQGTTVDYNVNDLGGLKAEKVVKGWFNSSITPSLYPDEYENLMKKYGFHEQYDPTNSQHMEKLKNMTNNTIKLSHYLIPVKDENVIRAGNLMNFTEDSNDGSGHMEDYESVKFIYAHSFIILIKPEETRQGGLLILSLPREVTFSGDADPIEQDLVTISADGVAFYKTEYDSDSRKVKMYFKRGLLPNENYGKPSNFTINIEKLEGVDDTSNFTIELQEMKYDLSSPETDYENYKLRFSNPIKPEKIPFYSMPCIIIHNKLDKKSTINNQTRNRNLEGDDEEESLYDTNSAMKEYELLNPYARYGIYIQELKHRQVYANSEVHNVKNPGLTVKSPGMAVISNVGITSVPTAEFLTTGILLIPAATSQSRIEWTDVWGRRWSQPLRSVFPDIPPIPPPLKNFMMSTTFEILTRWSNGYQRHLKWPSDELAYIHVQMKFVNNYPKFFLPTYCKDNEIASVENKISNFERDRIYTPDDLGFDQIYESDNKTLVMLGHSSVYGKCFKDNGSVLSARNITTEYYNQMKEAMLCAESDDPERIENCTNQLRGADLPKLNRRTNSNNDTWNYSPDVEKYYPKGYIKDNMWDLTHYDYDDNAMDKGYKYHCDNNLPGIDVSPVQNPAYYKPHNSVLFPIYKGLGYKISYSSDLKLGKFSPYHGWWSDNLQNKDNTLLAGQAKSNDISVGNGKELLKETDWVNAHELNDGQNGTLIKKRLKNIYVCKFNQHRVIVNANQSIYSYPNNVYENNVIPIINELDKDDVNYTNHDCKDDTYQYNASNISSFDNTVETSTDRDWLYFSINLRGGAKETINVLMTLEPFSDRRYEGITKVQDGGRFTYWNPVNGPNSFLIVDNVVNTVEGFRNDIDVSAISIPTTTTTFNSVTYQMFYVADINEILREYKETTYTNSYGFGDSTVTVYVGGTQDTSCKLNPGEYTIVKLTFYNNAGFDWNLLVDAIDFENKGSKAINGNDLLQGLVHTIQAPKKYNFLILDIPSEIKNYINITCSDHNLDVAPEFFDFQSINVATIRDSFEGSYFYNLKVLDNFPEKYKGRFWEINVTINKTCFDKLPGYNDPTPSGYHNYNLTVPPIKFAVKYGDTSKYKGKVFYTIGRSSNLSLRYNLLDVYEPKGIKIITEEEEVRINSSLGDLNTSISLNKIWNNLTWQTPINFTSYPSSSSGYNDIHINLSEIYPLFPMEKYGEPDIAKTKILVRSEANFVEYGYRTILKNERTNYMTEKNTNKTTYMAANTWIGLTSTGPWISLIFNGKKVDKLINGSYIESEVQKIYSDEDSVIKVKVSSKNSGNSICYNTSIYLYIDKELEIVESELKNLNFSYKIVDDENNESNDNDTDYQILSVFFGQNIGPGESKNFDLFIRYHGNSVNFRKLSETSKGITFIEKATVNLYQKENDLESFAFENLKTSYYVSSIEKSENYNSENPIDLEIKRKGTYEYPKVTLKVKINEEKKINYNYYYYRYVRTKNDDDNYIAFGKYELIDNNNKTSIDDSPLKKASIKGVNNYTVYYFVELYYNDICVNTTNVMFITAKRVLSIGAIVGIVICIIGVIGGGFLFYWFYIRKNRKNELEGVIREGKGEVNPYKKTSNRDFALSSDHKKGELFPNLMDSNVIQIKDNKKN